MTITQIQALIAGRTNGGSNPISTERNLWTAILNECCKMYEVKEIDVNLTLSPNFLTDNFDGTGLGKNDYLGFAICNGANGTQQRGGKVSVGYKPASAYQVIGSSGGAETHILQANQTPDKLIRVRTSQADNGEVGGQLFVMSDEQETSGISIQAAAAAVAHNNMQPYIVTLMIQRIS